MRTPSGRRESGVNEQRIDGEVAGYIPPFRIAAGAAHMMVKGRVHDLVSQGSGQSRRIQGLNKIRVVEERHSIGGHRWNRPALASLQAEQERAEEGMVQDERRCAPSEYAAEVGVSCLMQPRAPPCTRTCGRRCRRRSGSRAGSSASRLRNRPSISATMLAASAAVVTRRRSCFLRSCAE